jgi:hypothetical protein
VNIGSAAVGHAPNNGDDPNAVMVLTTDAPVSQAIVDEIIGSWDVFIDGRTVALG